MKELAKKVAEIKTVCMDRLDAITADGNELGRVFEELEAIIEAKKEVEVKPDVKSK
jgi:endonuclease IV